MKTLTLLISLILLAACAQNGTTTVAGSTAPHATTAVTASASATNRVAPKSTAAWGYAPKSANEQRLPLPPAAHRYLPSHGITARENLLEIF